MRRAKKNGEPPWFTKPRPYRPTPRQLMLYELEKQGSEDADNHFDAGDYLRDLPDLDRATDEMQNKAATEIVDDLINNMDLHSWAAQVDLDDEEPDEEMLKAWIRGWRPRALHRLKVAIQREHNETVGEMQLYYLIDAMDEEGEFSKTFILDIMQEAGNYTIVERGSFDDMLDLLARLSSVGVIALGNGHYPTLPLLWALPSEHNILYFVDVDPDLKPSTQREVNDEIAYLGGEDSIIRRYDAQLDELARRGYVWKGVSGERYEQRRPGPGMFPKAIVPRKNAARRGAR